MDSKLINDIRESISNENNVFSFTYKELNEDHIDSVEDLNSLLKYIRTMGKYKFSIVDLYDDQINKEITIVLDY